MQCTSCHADNREGRRFCSQCGGPLAVPCPQCGFGNEPDERFCGGCGTSLAKDGEPAPPATPDTAAVERRHLTVMFCDLVGSTALSERLDPEELREVIAAFQAVCSQAVRRFDGFVARFMGDGLLIYFGYPTAHEDDAERAVRAGLAVVNGVAALKLPDGSAPAVRVGIATGTVVAGDIIGQGASEERAVHGETPNLAARLQALAEPNSVAISEATRRLVAPLFVIEDLGTQQVKGLSTPVPVYRVHGANEAPNRFEAAAAEQLTPMIGRDEEMALLLNRWQRAKQGEGQMVTLAGEPGFGKSRITRALRDAVEAEPHHSILCFCSPYFQNSAFHPVVEQLKRRMRLDKTDTAAQCFDKIESELIGLGLPVDDHAPAIGNLLSLPVGERYPGFALTAEKLKQKGIEVMGDIIAATARQSTVLLVIEDLHWMDPSTLECLGQLIERVPRLPILMVLTFRPEFVPPWNRRGDVTELSLNRLGRDESRAIIERVSGGRPLPDLVLDEIVAKTDGVPLFIEELTKTVIESGLLRDTGERYELDGPLPRLAIPASLQDSLMARLDHLAQAKEVAQFASALGRRFSHEILHGTAPFPTEFIDNAMEQLVEAGLIYRRGQPPDAAYSYKHALVQDAAYQSLLKSRRRQFHTQIAQALLNGVGGLAASEPSLVAHHFTKAERPERAVPYWLEAGERAIERFANHEAIAHLGRGLEVLAMLPDDDNRVRWELALHYGLATALRVIDHLDEAFAALDAAETVAKAHDLAAELSRIHHMRGNLCFPLGRIEDCCEQHELALTFARAANSAVDEARALGGLGDAAYARGRMRTANGFFRECLELCRKNGFPLIAAANHNMIAFSRQYFLEIEGALEDGLAAAEAARKVDHRRAELLSETIVHNALCEMGRFEEAKQHLDRAYDLEQQIGARRFAAETLLFEAKTQAARGDTAAARAALEEALVVCRETGMGFMGPWVMADLANYAEDAESRFAQLDDAERALESGAVGHSHLWFYREAMEACLASGDLDRVERYADSLERYTRDEPLPWADFFAARGRALAAFKRGRCEESLRKELEKLREQAEDVRLVSALPAIEQALAGTWRLEKAG